MNNITIGIPRALFYYKYKYLWCSFFKELGINILISPYTDEQIMQIGKSISNKVCLPLQIYFGHVQYLINKVNYILIPRINNNESCYYYNSLYDITNNIFDTKILDYNIDNKVNEEEAFINMGKKLGFSKQTIINAYKLAKKEEYKQRKINYLLQVRKINRDNKKVLIIGEDYIYQDEYIKNKLINFIKDENIEIFYSNIINPDIKSYKKAIKSNIKCLKKSINKTIVITTEPCVLKNAIENDLKNTLIIKLDDSNINIKG